MADNSLTPPYVAAKPSFWSEYLPPSVFAGFLFVVFVGLNPFPSRDNVQAALMSSGEGDLPRQIVFTISFLIIVGFAMSIRGQKILQAIPVSLVILLLWCLLSIIWAIDPGSATRRLMLTIIIICCVMFSVDMLGNQRSLQVLKFVLATILIVNCVSVLIIPQAVHMAGEFEGELAGNWRGLHFHKNIAGPVAALTALLFYHHALTSNRWRDWFLSIAAVVFLAGTVSKTAIGFFGVALVISTIYRIAGRTAVGRQFFGYFSVALLVIAIIAWIAAYETFADLMADPGSFTGRVEIWHATFAYLREHWLLGSGFGSFWQIGDASPAHAVTNQTWILFVPHSHNGYIEIFVTTGIFGLLLSIFILIVIPLKQLFSYYDDDIGLRSLLLSMVIFIVLTNLLETIFLNRERPEWVIYLIVLAILHQISARSAKTYEAHVFQGTAVAENAPTFSVVIPVYNRAQLIGRAIGSVLGQTFSDFEIVVVDDGSSDDSAGMAARIGDPRIRVIRRENGGASAARNVGIDAARGRYIAFLDSDDTFLPHHLDTMRRLLDGTSNTAGYAYVLVDRGNGKTFIKPPRAIRSDESMATYLMCDRGFVTTCTLVVPAQIARQVRYRQDTRYGDDTDFAVRLYLNGCRFVMADAPGAVVQDRFDPQRLSAGRSGDKSIQWLEDLRPDIPEIAYYGYRGWHVAKGLAPSDPLGALRLYLTALRHRSYSPRLAAVILLQIFFPDKLYRKIADHIVAARFWSLR